MTNEQPATASQHGVQSDLDRLDLYPVAVVEDRYSGTYSGGLWLAVARADTDALGGVARISLILSEGPHGDDGEAMEFWINPPKWIAVGPNPDAAIMALIAKARASRLKGDKKP